MLSSPLCKKARYGQHATQEIVQARASIVQSLDRSARAGNRAALERVWELHYSGQMGLPQNKAVAYAYLMASVDLNPEPDFRQRLEQFVDDPNLYYRQLRDQLTPFELEQANTLRRQIVESPPPH
jgi:hypothetical protein